MSENKKKKKEHSEEENCYEITPKKETISYMFINLIRNIQEYNAGKI